MSMEVDDAETSQSLRQSISLETWAASIESHFERQFWIESNPAKRGRTGFYRDTVGGFHHVFDEFN